jgi:hypothetical protein
VGKVAGWIVLVVIGISFAAGLYDSLWGEQEGVTRYEDCRDKIYIEQASSDALFKRFTCSYSKTRTGKLLSGLCIHVVTEGPVCQAAYIYNKKAEITCTDPKFPYPAYDDLCHSDPQ